MSEYSPREETPMHYARGRGGGQADAGVIIRERPRAGHLILRGNSSDTGFTAGVETVSGLALPLTPCTWVSDTATGIYWLGPDEWLLVVAGGREEEVATGLRQTLSGAFSVVDVSGGQTLLNLSGAGVASLLKKSCHYDFHPGVFLPGRCVQTNFARVAALVAGCADGAFDLVIRRSFTDYLARWLLDAGGEWGVRIE